MHHACITCVCDFNILLINPFGRLIGVGSSPSLAWHGIWQARQVLETGTRWRIGNGASVNIQKDMWVSGLSSFIISSLPRDIDDSATVNLLMSVVPGM